MLLLVWKACTHALNPLAVSLLHAEMSLFILLRSSRLFFPVNFIIIYMTKFWQSPSICLVWPLPSSRTRVRNPEQQNMGRGAPHISPRRWPRGCGDEEVHGVAAGGGVHVDSIVRGEERGGETRRMFRDWMADSNKTYSSVAEEERRYAVFKKKRRRVEKHNAEADAGVHSYRLGL